MGAPKSAIKPTSSPGSSSEKGGFFSRIYGGKKSADGTEEPEGLFTSMKANKTLLIILVIVIILIIIATFFIFKKRDTIKNYIKGNPTGPPGESLSDGNMNRIMGSGSNKSEQMRMPNSMPNNMPNGMQMPSSMQNSMPNGMGIPSRESLTATQGNRNNLSEISSKSDVKPDMKPEVKPDVNKELERIRMERDKLKSKLKTGIKSSSATSGTGETVKSSSDANDNKPDNEQLQQRIQMMRQQYELARQAGLNPNPNSEPMVQLLHHHLKTW